MWALTLLDNGGSFPPEALMSTWGVCFWRMEDDDWHMQTAQFGNDNKILLIFQVLYTTAG